MRDGVALFLVPESRGDDPWREAASGLERALRASPELERRLFGVTSAALAPADRMFRALVLDERGAHEEAARIAESAERELYPAAYLECRERLLEAAVAEVARGTGPIVDLASGRCTLVERLARELDRPVLATDVSHTVLRRSRERLRALGLAGRVAFVCLDARLTPFADGSIATMTTYAGLGNVPDPGALLAEVRRAVSGVFAPLCTFFPEDDEANRAAARATDLDRLLFLATALEAFAEAGWRVETAAACSSEARPTPAGVVLEGARVDGLPVADTVVEWRLLRAR